MAVFHWPLAFGFISPWLLAGGLALSAVPLVIHLLRRRQFVDRPWAAMQFLQAALHSQSRRMRLESLALLVVRMLLIGTAAVALAQPFFDASRVPLNAAAGRQRILVVDTSVSMSTGEPGSTPLDRGRAMAIRVVQGAPAGDSFSLVEICRTPPLTVIPQAVYDRQAVLTQIEQLAATQESGDVAGALRAVRECLRDRESSATPEVVIVSDFQESNWSPDSDGAREAISRLLDELANASTVTCIPVSVAAPDNLAVTELKAVAVSTTDEGAVDLEATVLNASSETDVDVPLEVYAGDRRIAVASVHVPAGNRTTTQIPLGDLSSSDTTVRVEIPEDALPDDNRRWVVLPDRRPLDVLLVSGRPRTSDRRGAADFVRLALSPAGDPRHESGLIPTVVTDDRLDDIDLNRFDCVHLCNVAMVSDREVEHLSAYVESGGGLVISLGDQVQPSGYRAFQHGDDPLLPGRLIEVVEGGRVGDERVRLSPEDYGHPVVRPFAGNPDAGLLTTEIDRYWRLDVSGGPPLEIVLHYSTGDPAIIERPLGAGRVLIVTTALDDTWSNWALWPSFVPIVHETTRASARGRNEDRARIVGDSLTRHLRPEEFGARVEHHSPAGTVVEVPKTSRLDGASTISVVAESNGIHELHVGPPQAVVERFAVNIDPIESKLESLTRDEILRLTPDRTVQVLSEWRPSATPAAVAEGGSIASRLVLAVLGLLLVEQLMAWHFRAGVAALVLLAICLLVEAATGRVEAVLIGLIVLTPLAFAIAFLRGRLFVPRSVRARF